MKKNERLWWVTFWTKEGDDDDVDYSFEVSAKTKDEAIQKIKEGKGTRQYSVPPRLARKFSAIPSE